MTSAVESAITFFIQMVIIVDPVVAMLAVQYVISGSAAVFGG